MHRIIQGVGALVALVGVAIILIGLSRNATGLNGPAQFYVALAGLGVLLPGAMLYCFGSIVEHLRAIRRNTERQLAIFEQRLGGDRT